MLKRTEKYYSAKDLPQGKYVIQVTKANTNYLKHKQNTNAGMAFFPHHNNSIAYRKLLLIVMKYFEKKGSTHAVIAALVMNQKEFNIDLMSYSIVSLHKAVHCEI